MANETTTTTAAANVPSEIFAEGMRMYPRLRPAGIAVSWQQPGKGNVPISFTRLNTAAVIPAGTKTEGASFTRVASATAATQVTPAFVGSELALTDELMMAANDGSLLESAILQDRIRALYVRIETDLLATITGSSNTYGSTTTNLTRENAMEAIAAYWALNLEEAEMHAFLLSNAAAAQFGTDSISTTATTAEMRNQFGTNVLLGEFQGFMMFRAAAAPAEGAGYSSLITPVGNVKSGLLLGVSEAVTARPPTRGSEGERDAEGHQVVRAMYGVADDDGFYLEVQTAA